MGQIGTNWAKSEKFGLGQFSNRRPRLVRSAVGPRATKTNPGRFRQGAGISSQNQLWLVYPVQVQFFLKLLDLILNWFSNGIRSPTSKYRKVHDRLRYPIGQKKTYVPHFCIINPKISSNPILCCFVVVSTSFVHAIGGIANPMAPRSASLRYMGLSRRRSRVFWVGG